VCHFRIEYPSSGIRPELMLGEASHYSQVGDNSSHPQARDLQLLRIYKGMSSIQEYIDHSP